MRFVQAIGRGIGFVLSTVAKVLGTLNGAKPAGDDLAARLNQPSRDDYRP
ncbi:hypothetical protein EDF31_105268 [Curtobacterium sp. PhB142]|nr:MULTISPECIES: hypothetical protein [unclassified Curtobacterium]TCL85250.1 hypothetical protein EDF31_105268 [Curtobacterium sp. PhB142]TCM01819.1 hypothetical protein EDF26_10584 [Curtobacterium sp. PhB134]TCU45668.1 hypothetical protein EDF33_104371 [Curtobacterium sp. PhB146]TDW42327.1 hypothetical protein EDF52_11520 [Curtobacterium sp. PhB42]TDW52853.1 hypothetical protein EDF47_11220 [Curtobacterium sp. PhB190]